MMLINLINELKQTKYKTLLISTTSRNSTSISRLPDKSIAGELAANLLVTDEYIASQLLKDIDGYIETILIDVEKKQEIDLMKIANKFNDYSQILPYKPNDVTVDAADQLILYKLGIDLTGKKILIYGTGNISFKLALRLLEREVDVSIVGRNLDKIHSIVKTLNMIKPGYSKATAWEHTNNVDGKYDGLISFVSSEKIVEPVVVSHIRQGGFAIDGGIGNFQGQFIVDALKKEVSVLRLDVRLGNPFLLAGLIALSSENEFFNSIIGSCMIGNMSVVAGGIIGEDGSIIVDRIKNPTQIIGVANGYGGLKNEVELTENDRKNLQYAKKTFL